MCTHLETYFHENIVSVPHIIPYSEARILNFSSLFFYQYPGVHKFRAPVRSGDQML